MKKKRILSLLLMLVLLLTTLTGCKTTGGTGDDVTTNSAENENSSGAGTGRFMESRVTLPAEVEMIGAMRRLEDGSLHAIGIGSDGEGKAYYILNSSDYGVNWNMTPVQGLTEEYYPKMAIDPDGRAVFIPYTREGKAALKVCDLQGETSEVSVSLPELDDAESENHIWQAEFDEEGNLIVMDSNDSLYKVDLSEGTCQESFDARGTKINYFGLAGNRLIAVYDNGTLVYDAATGEMADTEAVIEDMIKENRDLVSVNTDQGYPMVFAAGTGEKDAVFANENGIFHYTIGGSVSEQLVGGSLMSVGNAASIFYAICMMDAEHIFLSANDGQNTNLFLYSYDGAAAAAPDSEITVYALEESDTLRYAVSVFQSEHPDVYVNLQIGMSGDDGVTLEDALSVLNTDMMAGKGPDVLILDGMPVDSYIEKGIIVDISDVVNEVAQEDGLFSNIVDASTVDGCIYGMPARFLIPLVEADADTVDASASLETLADRAEELKRQGTTENVMQPRAAKHLLRELYYADSASWKKADGSLDEEKIADYLTQAKRIYDVDQYGSELELGSEKISGLGIAVGTIVSTGMMTGEFQVGMGTLSEITNFQLMRSTDAVTGATYDVINRDHAASFIPYLTAGVTAGENEEMAKAFVKTLLGKEAGTASNGIPVNRAAFDQQIEKTNDNLNLSIGFGPADGDEVYGVEYVALTEEDISNFTGMVEGLTVSALTDRTIQTLVTEQGEAYLNGEQSLETAVNTIMKKVNLYLAE